MKLQAWRPATLLKRDSNTGSHTYGIRFRMVHYRCSTVDTYGTFFLTGKKETSVTGNDQSKTAQVVF